MSAEYWNTPLDHTNDAGYRAWGAELKAKLAAHGLVQTADTGQVDWTSVTRPAANTFNAYEIWRFDDAMQASAPIFIKFEYGSSSTNAPNIRASTGSGSNGSGSLTGLTTAVQGVMAYRYNTYSGASYPSYICVAEGFFGLGWKGSGSDWGSGILISRTVAPNGVPNGDGYEVRHFNQNAASSGSCYSVSNLTNTIYASTAQTTCLIPYGLTSTIVGATPQVFKTYQVTPRVRPNAFVLGIRNKTEIPEGTQFLATVVGGIQRTYVVLPDSMSGYNYLATGGVIAMLYE